MRIKLKIVSFLIIFLAFFTTIGSVYAKEEVNKSDFSSYINCFKNDLYDEEIYVSPLTNNRYYNIGNKCKDKYPELTEYKATSVKKDYGFELENEFYVSPVLIAKSGTYKIDIYRYKKEKGIIKKYGTTPLETTYITVDLEYTVNISKTTFSYDTVDSSNSLIQNILSYYNKNVKLTTESSNLIKETYNFLRTSKGSKEIKIKVYYEGKNYTQNILLTEAKNNNENYVNLKEKALNINLATLYNYNYKGQNITSCLYDLLYKTTINELNLPVEQSVSLKFDSSRNYEAVLEDGYKCYSIDATVSDSFDKNNCCYPQINILVYGNGFVKEENLKCSYSNFDYYKYQEKENDIKTYLEFNVGGKTYLDYLNDKLTHSYKFELNENNNKIITTLKYENINKTFPNPINIVEDIKKIKIVTNYNYLIVDDNNFSYKNQVGFYDGKALTKDLESKDYYFRYDFLDNNTCKISLFKKDSNEEIDTKTIQIYNKTNEKTNVFKKMLKNYGDFLRIIF